jgi:DNA-binding transcriptional MerR regulator
VSASDRYLNASEAAHHLGVSVKALRLYEERRLLAPVRTAAGWRAYGPDQIARAAEIVVLRALGFSLTQVERVLTGDAQGLETALTAHQAKLEDELRRLTTTVEKIRLLRGDFARGNATTAGDLARLVKSSAEPTVAFDLPWPWGGERFELCEIRPITYITGPLGSGKTRLARRLAEFLPDAAFLGLDRLADGGTAAQRKLTEDEALRDRVERAMAWLREDGASPSEALVALLALLEADRPSALVVDMVEQGLDEATQGAMIAYLRRRGSGGRPLFLLTRSCAILDLEAVGANEAIIYCPANHSPPIRVTPYSGAPGYEAVATCLAPPNVRARTEGVIAWRPQGASWPPPSPPPHSN